MPLSDESTRVVTSLTSYGPTTGASRMRMHLTAVESARQRFATLEKSQQELSLYWASFGFQSWNESEEV